MKKNIIKYIVAVMTVITLVVCHILVMNDIKGRSIAAALEKTTDEGWEYVILKDDNGEEYCVITGYDGKENGTLRISGTIENTEVKVLYGKVLRTGYEVESLVIPKEIEQILGPVFDFVKVQKEVVFEEGSRLKRIEGKSAMGFQELKTITLPDSIEYIGDETFAYAFRLKELNIPRNLKYIGNGAFYDTEISSINVESDNEYFENKDGFLLRKADHSLIAFEHDRNTEQVTIPAYVQAVDPRAFYGNLKAISVVDENEYLSSINGNLYSKDGSVLYRVAPDMSNDEFAFGNNVTVLGSYSFDLCKVNEVHIPDSVTRIEQYAFFRQDFYLSKQTGLEFADLRIFTGTIHFSGSPEDWKRINILDSKDGDKLYYTVVFDEEN